MLETITSVNGFVNGIVWGPVGLALLFGTGFVMSVRTGFFQFGHFRYWLRNTIGAIFTNRDITAHTEKNDKAISQFQSLCTALAATIGTGNIVGVATAILSGGPGAIFWMWAMAILGMMTNYSENVLGIFYRRKNADGEWSGGAMYYLADGLGSKKGCKKLGRVLAVLFACFCVLASFGIGNMSQINSIAGNMNAAFQVPNLLTGILLAVLSALVILGGLKRVAAVTEKVVPLMALFYILGALTVVLTHITAIPAAFAAIFKGAFAMQAAGGGVLGSQIAFQSAYCGFDVTIWLRSEGSIGRTQPKLDHLHQVYIDTINLMATPDGQTPANWANGIADFDGFDPKKCLEKVEAAYKNTHLELDMAKAVADADLVIESMAENVEDKISFYQKLAPLMPAKTVLVTNSSTLLPSKFAKYTGRPDEYLSLHFANSIWKNNIAEIMAQSKTDPKVFDTVMQFANDIRMIALPVRKEKSGYLLNSMLVPLLFSAMDLYVNGISDPESIDKAWTLGTGAPKGPFHILDTVGLTTAHNIVKMYLKIPSFLAPYNFKGMDKMLKEYIDAGKLGQSSGEGFFKYEK